MSKNIGGVNMGNRTSQELSKLEHVKELGDMAEADYCGKMRVDMQYNFCEFGWEHIVIPVVSLDKDSEDDEEC